MSAPRADSVYFSVVLIIALTLVGAWSMRAGGESAQECGADCLAVVSETADSAFVNDEPRLMDVREVAPPSNR